LEFSDLRNSIYREVKEEFRPRWAEYYDARKNGLDTESLTAMKAQLIADQREVLEPRRNAACQELLGIRSQRYHELLDHQNGARHDFRWHQEAGLDVTLFLSELEERKSGMESARLSFRPVADEITEPHTYAQAEPGDGHAAGRTADDVRFDPVAGIGGNIASFADALFFDLINLGSARPVPLSAEEKADRYREAAENVTKQQQHHSGEEEDTVWRERQKEYYHRE
jgi:hypothetical protein